MQVRVTSLSPNCPHVGLYVPLSIRSGAHTFSSEPIGGKEGGTSYGGPIKVQKAAADKPSCDKLLDCSPSVFPSAKTLMFAARETRISHHRLPAQAIVNTVIGEIPMA